METAVRAEWLKYEEAERLTGLSRVTLWRLHRSGELKIARVGRSVRINRASLEEFMERQSTEDVEG